MLNRVEGNVTAAETHTRIRRLLYHVSKKKATGPFGKETRYINSQR